MCHRFSSLAPILFDSSRILRFKNRDELNSEFERSENQAKLICNQTCLYCHTLLKETPPFKAGRMS